MPDSLSSIFIFGAIAYAAVLGLGCAGLVAYNIWNIEDMQKIRRREERDFYESFQQKPVSKDALGEISDSDDSREGLRAQMTTTGRPMCADDSRRQSPSRSLRYGLEGTTRASVSSSDTDDSWLASSDHSLSERSTTSGGGCGVENGVEEWEEVAVGRNSPADHTRSCIRGIQDQGEAIRGAAGPLRRGLGLSPVTTAGVVTSPEGGSLNGFMAPGSQRTNNVFTTAAVSGNVRRRSSVYSQTSSL